MDSRRLSRLQMVFLFCFVALLLAASCMVYFSQSAEALKSQDDSFYTQDDDCDGIPNYEDAQFTVRTYVNCYDHRAQKRGYQPPTQTTVNVKKPRSVKK